MFIFCHFVNVISICGANVKVIGQYMSLENTMNFVSFVLRTSPNLYCKCISKNITGDLQLSAMVLKSCGLKNENPLKRGLLNAPNLQIYLVQEQRLQWQSAAAPVEQHEPGGEREQQ